MFVLISHAASKRLLQPKATSIAMASQRQLASRDPNKSGKKAPTKSDKTLGKFK